MAVPRSSFFLGSAILAMTLFPKPAQADEIRLKDGQKLYGVIVAYEDNMFKVKTDFGFVLVEKDKIASIVPNVTCGHNAAKAEPSAAEKPAAAKPEAAHKTRGQRSAKGNSAAFALHPVTIAQPARRFRVRSSSREKNDFLHWRHPRQ